MQIVEEDILKFLSEYQPHDNLGWGTEPTFTFDEFQQRPFQPFSRLEKLSKCCDFLQTSKQQAAQRTQEEEFQTVGAEKAVAKVHKKGTKKPAGYYQASQHQGYPSFKWDHSSNRRSKFTQAYRRVVVTKTKFKDSIVIQADWVMLHEAQKQIIEKTPQSLVTYNELLTSGQVRQYNNMFNKTKPLYEKQIPALLDDVASSSTLEDGYLKQLADDRQTTDKLPTVYTTDKLLYAILTLKYSVYPWDIFVTKRDNQLIFDKAPENYNRTTYLELQTINENTSGDMKEEEKVVFNDCEESTYASLNWQLYAVQHGEVNEELSGEKHATAQYSTDFAYKYIDCAVKERLDKGLRNDEPKAGDTKFHIIVRTQIDACDGEGNPMLIKALNQCEAGQDWRKQLETSSGQLTSQVCVANTNNMAKWLCQAMIAEVSEIKVGFVARQHPKDQNKHSLLQVETYRFKDISSIISFKIAECWQNIRYLVDYMSKEPDGQYVVMKPAYKTAFRVYRLEEKNKDQNESDDG